MEMSGPSAPSNPEQVAHGRPAVERWFSLSGLVPLPVFLALHLSRELALAVAPDVSELVRPQPGAFSLLTGVLLIWLPLSFHAALGSWFLISRRTLVKPAPGDDVAALALRVSRFTSVVALLFLAYHAREYPLAVWLGEADARDAGLRLVGRLSSTSLGVPLRGAAYLLGLAATLAHAGLAVHRALLREGWLGSAARRRRSARWCALVSSLLFVLGAAAIIRVASGVLLQ
jgi:succinate dehydrogenase/fumarate reductase cytochrome b subunit